MISFLHRQNISSFRAVDIRVSRNVVGLHAFCTEQRCYQLSDTVAPGFFSVSKTHRKSTPPFFIYTLSEKTSTLTPAKPLGCVGMSNVLSDEKKQQVIALGKLGWTLRRIEQATGVRRETASNYLKAAGIGVRPSGSWGRRSPAKPANEVTTDPSESNRPMRSG